MTEKEQRVFAALEAYRERFGDEAYPGLDSLPAEYRDEDMLAELLNRCVREGKPLQEMVSISRGEGVFND